MSLQANNYKVSKDMEKLLKLLEGGLEYTLKQLYFAEKHHKYGSCSQLQLQAILLKNIIEAIKLGWHDDEFETEVIVGYLFSMIPMKG